MKLMNRLWPIAAFLLLLALVWVAIPAESALETYEEEEEEGEMGGGPLNPGYHEQWLIMKGLEAGYLPVNYSKRWAATDAANKTPMTNLTDIQVIGPDNVGGRTRGLVIDWSDSLHYIAAGVSGGVWNSFDRGATWAPANDQAISLSVTDITQSPFEANILYYSSGESAGNSADISGAGVFKSTDNGLTWTQLPGSEQIDALNETWAIRHSLVDSHTIYVATDFAGIYVSTDAGANFTQLFDLPGATSVTDIEVFEDSSIVAGINGVGVYRSPNGQPGTFTAINNGLPNAGFRAVRLAGVPRTSDTLYTAFEDNTGSSYDSGIEGIFFTTDGGQNWTRTATEPDSVPNAQTRFPWYAFAFEVAPNDWNRLILGSVDLFMSADGGDTWIEIARGWADNHIVRFEPNIGDFLIGNDGGIYRYNVATARLNVLDLNNNYNVTQFYHGDYFPDTTETRTFGGTQDNGTQASRLSSATFGRVLGGDGAFNAINRQNPNTAYASFQNGEIRRTTNAQSISPNFTDVKPPIGNENTWFINPFYINEDDGAMLFYVTRSRVYRTLNNGNSWTAVSSNLNDPYSVALSEGSNPTVYWGGRTGLLQRLDNGRFSGAGTAFNLSGTAPSAVRNSFVSHISVAPRGDSVIYVSYSDFSSNSRLWKVFGADTDQPIWVSLGDNLPDFLPVNWFDVDENDEEYIIVGTDFGVYSTVDGGANWDKEEGFPNVPIATVKIRQTDRRLFVWTHGRGLWTARLLPRTAPVSRAEAATERIALQFGPNPTRSTLTVRMATGNFPAEASIQIRDLQGRVWQQRQVPNRAELQLDVQSLAGGIYFLELHSPNGHYRERFFKR